MYTLTPIDLAIQKQIEKLDSIAIQYEAKWGIGNLPKLADPDMLNKWQRQMEKLNTAIQASALDDVTLLVQGTIRGYAALEAHVMALGHTPPRPDTWEVRHPESGNVYRICKNNIDAGAATEKGFITYTLEEIARILEKQSLDTVTKQTQTKKITPKPPMDWDKGEEIPF